MYASRRVLLRSGKARQLLRADQKLEQMDTRDFGSELQSKMAAGLSRFRLKRG